MWLDFRNMVDSKRILEKKKEKRIANKRSFLNFTYITYIFSVNFLFYLVYLLFLKDKDIEV